MKLHKQKRGALVAFEYFDRVDQCWKPRVAVVLAQDEGRLTLCFDVARGDYRSFKSRRVRNLRIVEVVAANKTEAQAKAFAAGYRDGTGPSVGVACVRQNPARDTHGLNSPHAILAVKKQRQTA